MAISDSITVKYRTVSIRIYPWKHSSGREYWRFKADDRHVTRSTLAKAKQAATNHAQATYKGTLDLDTLTPEQVRKVKRMMEADPNLSLVDEFILWHAKKAPKKLILDAWTEFMVLKEGNAGRSTQNVRTLRKHVKPFVDIHSKSPVATITVHEVETYLTANAKNGNRTRRNIRASLVTFFRWCRLRDYLPDEKRTVAEKQTGGTSSEIPPVADQWYERGY